MVLLVLGVVLVVAGAILLFAHLPGVAVAAFVVGLFLILAAIFRRRGRRTSAGDAAILGSINS